MIAYKFRKWFGEIRPLQSVSTYDLIKELELRGYGVNIADNNNNIEYRGKQQ